MSDLLDFSYQYISGTVEMLTGFYFFHRFLGRKLLPTYYVLSALAGIVIITLFSAGSIAEFIAYVMLFTVSGIMIGKVKNVIVLLYAVITIEIMHLCYGIFHSLSCILLPFIFTSNPYIMGYVFMAAGSILSLALSVLCYVMIEKYFKNDETGGGKYVLMILTPALLIYLVSEYISREIYGNTVTIDSEGVLLSSSPYQILFIQIFGIASLFCMLYAYKKLTESFRLNREISLLEQETHSLTQYVEEAKIRFEKTKSFRHDVKNHITMIRELIQNDKKEAALQYIGDMEQFTADMSFPVNTNNPVVDILLENKLGIAKSRQIEVECSLIIPCPCEVNDMDFCIVLSNALDNAISACNRISGNTQKYIHITGNIQGAFLLIEISNSYIGKGMICRGTGLANIKAAAEKYQGAVDIRTEEGTFTLSVLFIIPQQSDSISQQAD